MSTKLDVLNHLVAKVDHLIIGGGMANTFLAARGVDVGKSLCEHDLKDQALAVLDAEPLLDAELLALCRWAADYYHHPIGEVLAAVQRDGFGIEQAQALVRTPAERELALTGAGGGVEVPRPRSLEERLQAAPLDQLTTPMI